MKTTDNSFEKNIFKSASKTYFTSSYFFPKSKRTSVYELYSFVRLADDFVDEIPQNKKAFLMLQKSYNNKTLPTTDPGINKSLANIYKLQKKYKISDKNVTAFLGSMEMDLYKQKYSTMKDTLKYIYGSAEVIGLMMAKILELSPKSYRFAEYQGRSMQYINFIRDIEEDIDLQRCYFPESVLKKYKIVNWDKNLVNHKNFRPFIREQISQYQIWQKEAEKGWKFIPYRSRIAVLTASDGYKWTAKQIFKNPGIIFVKKIKPSKSRLLLYGLKNFFKAIFY